MAGAGRGEWGAAPAVQGRVAVNSPRQPAALRGAPRAEGAARHSAGGPPAPRGGAQAVPAARAPPGAIPWNGGSPRQRASAPAAGSPQRPGTMSARPAAAAAPASPQRPGAAATARPSSPGGAARQAPGTLADEGRQGLARTPSWRGEREHAAREGGSPAMSRVSSSSACGKDGRTSSGDPPAEGGGLFHVIQQLAAAENALWNILDGLKSNSSHASFFCREYWGCSCSRAQLSLERLGLNERKQRQVQQACILESLSLGVAAHLCSGSMQAVSVTIRSRLRNLIYYVHENCLVLLDMVCQRWMLDSSRQQDDASAVGHCPENLNLDILIRVKRYRRFRREEHAMALRQHNELILNVVRQLCRGSSAPAKRAGGGSLSGPGARSPGTAGAGAGARGGQSTPLVAVNEVLQSRLPLDRLRCRAVRAKMLQCMSFRPLLSDSSDPDCPWPTEDPYERYGAEDFAPDGPAIWFEPLPPMLPNLELVPKLPAQRVPGQYTLVLDLDETLLHYAEQDGMGSYNTRPGMHDFLERMNQLGFELVIFTAATQDYADWVIDQVDPTGLVHHRLYRQHALPWGPVFVKDLACLGRDLDRTLIIDNVQENFMLQPGNGIFILTWYEDPHDTALSALSPLLEELLATGVRVPDLLEKYRDQIPVWAGFDQGSQLGTDYTELEGADGYLDGGYADVCPEDELLDERDFVDDRRALEQPGRAPREVSGAPHQPAAPTPPGGGGGGPCQGRQAHHAPFMAGCGPLQAPPPARQSQPQQRLQPREAAQRQQRAHGPGDGRQVADFATAEAAAGPSVAAGHAAPPAYASRYQPHTAPGPAGARTPQAPQQAQPQPPQPPPAHQAQHRRAAPAPAPQAYAPPPRTAAAAGYPQVHAAHQAPKAQPQARQAVPAQVQHQHQPGPPQRAQPAPFMGVAGPYQHAPPPQAFHQPGAAVQVGAAQAAAYGQRPVGIARPVAAARR